MNSVTTDQMMSVDRLQINLNARTIATLVGLKNIKVPVKTLICLDEITERNRNDIVALERWLQKHNFPRLLISTNQGTEKSSSLCEHLLQSWSWSQKECEFVLRLEGLPLFQS